MNNLRTYIQENITGVIDYLLESNDYEFFAHCHFKDLLQNAEYALFWDGLNAVNDSLRPYIEEYLFQPDKRMNDCHGDIVYFLKEWIRRHPSCLDETLAGLDLIDFLEKFAKTCNGEDMRDVLFLGILKGICLNGKDYDWEDLYKRTKLELVNGVKDYNWARMTMLSMLMGVVMIMRQCPFPELEDTLEDYQRNWNFFGDCYSILLGKVVGSRFHHINAVLGQFAGGHMKDKAWAAKELINFCQKPLRNGMTEKNWGKLCEIRNRLLIAIDNIEQDYTLQALFKILFPKVECDSYANAAPRYTAQQIQTMLEEKKREIAERDKMIEDWKSKAESLEKQVDELTGKMKQALVEDLISIELLKEAILSYPAVIARMLFSNLDWVLEGKNPAWNSHRDELKQAIQEKEREEAASKVTHVTAGAYYESGATHDDHRNTISLETKSNDEVAKLIGRTNEKRSN